jgi:hypothetical protein
MKSLARRIKGALAVGLITTIAIAAEWSQALGQSTPDRPFLQVPEPSSMALLGTAVAGAYLLHRFRKRK